MSKEYVPCRDYQYRDPVDNKCKNIANKAKNEAARQTRESKKANVGQVLDKAVKDTQLDSEKRADEIEKEAEKQEFLQDLNINIHFL